jgi:hypothetical protein
MRTLRFLTLLAALLVLTCGRSNAQVMHYDIRVSITGIDFGPGIGTVFGTYVYRYGIKLSSEGYIERMHWNVLDSDLHNDLGEKVNIVDSGMDNLGAFWQIWNYINAWNEGWNIHYDLEDGWLNDYMPPEMPSEGSFVNLSCKISCKGTVLKMPLKLVIHPNNSGSIEATVIE